MKNVKSLIAIVALAGVFGVVNSNAAVQTSASDQSYSQSGGTWLDDLFNYVIGYLPGDDKIDDDAGTSAGKLAVNHNETLVRDDS